MTDWRGHLPLYKHGMLPINLLLTGLPFCKLSDTHSTLQIRLYWIQFEMVHLTHIFPIFQKFHFFVLPHAAENSR